MDTWRLWRIEQKIDRILRIEGEIKMDQATFDTELAGLVTAVTDLSSAIDAFISTVSAGMSAAAAMRWVKEDTIRLSRIAAQTLSRHDRRTP